MSLIYKIICEPHGGAPLGELAKEVYELSQRLGIETEFNHNDRRYKVTLVTEEIKK